MSRFTERRTRGLGSGREAVPSSPRGLILGVLRPAKTPSATATITKAATAHRGTRFVDCVLTGTGNDDHLRANLDSICAADVEPRVRERLIEVFGEIEGVTAE